MVNLPICEKLDIFDESIFDHSVISLHEHTYKLYGSPNYGNSDMIRISMNFQDFMLDISIAIFISKGSSHPVILQTSIYPKMH